MTIPSKPNSVCQADPCVLYFYAVDANGKLTSADSAARGEFTCLDHGCKMVLRKGEINQPHFAHLSGAGAMCSVESSEHKAAKLAIAEAIEDTERRVSVVFACQHCQEESIGFTLPGGTTAVDEYQYLSFRIDIAALLDDVPALFVEILHSHPVDDEKSTALRDSRIPWIEIGSIAAVRTPYTLRPLAGSFGKHTCVGCEAWLEGRRLLEAAQSRLAASLAKDAEEKQRFEREQYAHERIASDELRTRLSQPRVPAEEKRADLQPYACPKCAFAHPGSRIACFRCGTFAPESVQRQRMRLSSTEIVWQRHECVRLAGGGGAL